MQQNSQRKSRRDNEFRVRRFAEEYVIDGNGARAARAAGWRGKRAKVRASQLLHDPDVQAAIRTAQAKLSEESGITARATLQHFWMIATADASEIIKLQRGCCRYCHGRGFQYQRTVRELEKRRARLARLRAKQAAALGQSSDTARCKIDEEGGAGYNRLSEPHPDCPQCFGEGVLRVRLAGTDELSPQAALLYAGAVVRPDGINIKLHDQLAALVQVGRAVGLFRDGLILKGSGQNAPDPLEALLASINGAGVGVGR